MLLTRFSAQEKRKEYRAMEMGTRRAGKVGDKEGEEVSHRITHKSNRQESQGEMRCNAFFLSRKASEGAQLRHSVLRLARAPAGEFGPVDHKQRGRVRNRSNAPRTQVFLLCGSFLQPLPPLHGRPRSPGSPNTDEALVLPTHQPWTQAPSRI